MNLKQKALSVVGIAALTLGMTTGIAAADEDSTTGGFEVEDCAEVSEVAITSDALDFGPLEALTSYGILGPETFAVEVDNYCNLLTPWQVDVTATDFIYTGPHANVMGDFDSGWLELDSNGDAANTIPWDGDPNNALPVDQFSVPYYQLGTTPYTILSSNVDVFGYFFGGATGISTASWDANLDLSGELLLPGSWESEITVTLGPIVD